MTPFGSVLPDDDAPADLTPEEAAQAAQADAEWGETIQGRVEAIQAAVERDRRELAEETEAARDAWWADKPERLAAADAWLARLAPPAAAEPADPTPWRLAPSIAATAPEAAALAPWPSADSVALDACLQLLGVDVRYNIRSARTEFDIDPLPGYVDVELEDSGGWTASTDRIMGRIFDGIARSFTVKRARGEDAPLKFSMEARSDLLNALTYSREVDPFDDWLRALEPWDGTQRVDRILTFFGADPGPLAAWASRYLTLAAVQRTRERGCELREFPVLIGAQGIGKSQLLRQLLPPEFPEFFTDSVDLGGNAKEKAEGLQGRVIVELAEMHGSDRASVEALKAFCSRQDDGGTRLSYRRDPEPLLRSCALIGTSNHVDSLPNDPSGLTRFVPIRLRQGVDVAQEIAPLRAQLWAEALHLYETGTRANLPRDLMVTAAETAEAHRKRDTLFEDQVDAWLDAQGSREFRLQELFDGTGLDTKGGASQRVGRYLRAKGWDNALRRIDGKVSRLWNHETV